MALVISIAALVGCSGARHGANARARELCESRMAAQNITDPYGAGYKATVNGKLRATHAWASTASLLRGWPKPSGEGPAVRPGTPDYWKSEAPSRFIAVCYIHGSMAGQRPDVPATLIHFQDALVEARDEHTVYLLWARAAGQALTVQKPPTKRG